MTTKEAIKNLTTDHYKALEVIVKVLEDNRNAIMGMTAFLKERGLIDEYDRWVEVIKEKKVH